MHLRQKEDAMHFPVHFPGRLIGAAAIACAAALTPVAALAAASSFAAPATASAPRCTTYKLVIYLDVPLGNSYAGGDYYYIQFTNLSGHACTLRGYPGSRQSASAASRSAARPAGAAPAQPRSPSPTAPRHTRTCRSQIRPTTGPRAPSACPPGRAGRRHSRQQPDSASTRRTRPHPR